MLPSDPGEGPTYTARALIALALLTVLRLVVAAATPLSPDEAYYWVWSHALQPGYLDHPPMVALWIRAGTMLAGQGAFGIRLLAPLSAALGSVLLARAADDLFPGRRLGIPAATLLNATLLLGAGAVTMTPDTPLLFFWAATVWAMARVIATGRPAWWLAVGLAAGGALDSKYTAMLLGAGIALWLIAAPSGRRWLRTIWPWLGGLIALACFVPVLGWNAAHGWASFAKQGGRTGDWRPAQALGHIGELLGSQLGLGTPLVALLCAAGVWAAARRWRQGPAPALLAALTLPGIAVFLQHAVGDRVQANWPAILFPAACVAAAAYAPRFWRPAAALGFAMTAVVYLQAATAAIPLPRKMDPTLIQMGGWDALAQAAGQQPGDFLAADNYGVAAMLAHDLPGPVLGVGPRWSLFTLPSAPVTGRTGILIRSHRRSGPPDAAPWLSITPAGTLIRSRDGVVAEEYDLFRVTARGDMVRLPNR
jgi:4-amino-4-deoxy-L-arabinose transferase-like glycosyltransferase